MQTFLIGGDSTHDDLAADRVGSKAANLARLARIGLRVPPAFVLGTDACREVMDAGGRLPEGARPVLRESMARLERATRLQFGGCPPLLVSVRSSPPVSMPGMLDTVLNVGLTDVATHGLLRTTGNPSLVWDTSRRFAQAFAETVCGCSPVPFIRARDRVLATAAAQSIDDVDPLTLRELARESVELVQVLAGTPLPTDPYAQLEAAIAAVFRSWSSPRAVEYRRMSHVDETTGTGVIVQAMVMGNGGASSGSGVGFTRNPATGADELFIDFLFNAQGEDVVSGRHRLTEVSLLAAMLPDVHAELMRAKPVLEAEFGDMQDFEFTVEDGTLYFLQSRSGKRTPWAALQIAVDLVQSHLIGPADALRRLAPYQLESIQRVRLAPGAHPEAVASAIPAGMGLAVGAIVFDRGRAQSLAATRPVILVRPDLTTEDVSGISAAAGILTTNGGRTSHAAVVARHLGKVCLAGCGSLQIDDVRRRCSFGTHVFGEGDVITLDGESGLIYAGAVPVAVERPEAALDQVRSW